MGNFYLNNKKTYEFKELITNWFLTVLVTSFIIFATLFFIYLDKLSDVTYVKTTLADGTVTEQINGNVLGQLIIYIMLTMFLFVSSYFCLEKKWDLRNTRNSNMGKERLRDQYDKAKINKMNKKELFALVKKLRNKKIIVMSKKREQEIKKLTKEQIKLNILRSLYPATTKIIINKVCEKKQEEKK